MKLERLIIGLLIIALLWLAFNRVPKYKGTDIRYLTKYEQRIDTLLKDTIVFKTKIRRFKDTLIVYKDSLIYAKENNDTVKIIKFQDSVIVQQDFTIKWQDTLINQMDSIVMYQNKVSDKQKLRIQELKKDVEKETTKKNIWKKATIFVTALGLTTYLIK